jgi:methylated-DNA-[protein]-cysteine S-methyltransferase
MRFETATLEAPIGPVAIAWRGETVYAIEMGWAKNRTRWETRDVPGSAEDHLARRLRARFPEIELSPGSSDAGPVRTLRRYFEGDVRAIDALRTDPGGDGFQARVWEELRRIPAGRTCTYGEIAARAGSPGSARAAGGAVGANPIPIVIPCHRVVGASGRLTGFGGGLPRKRWLLVHEGAAFVDDAPRQLSLSWARPASAATRPDSSTSRRGSPGT